MTNELVKVVKIGKVGISIPTTSSNLIASVAITLLHLHLHK